MSLLETSAPCAARIGPSTSADSQADPSPRVSNVYSPPARQTCGGMSWRCFVNVLCLCPCTWTQNTFRATHLHVVEYGTHTSHAQCHSCAGLCKRKMKQQSLMTQPYEWPSTSNVQAPAVVFDFKPAFAYDPAKQLRISYYVIEKTLGQGSFGKVKSEWWCFYPI